MSKDEKVTDPIEEMINLKEYDMFLRYRASMLKANKKYYHSRFKDSPDLSEEEREIRRQRRAKRTEQLKNCPSYKKARLKNKMKAEGKSTN